MPLPYQPWCPVCGDPEVNPHTLGIRFLVEPETGRVLSRFLLGQQHLGFPGKVHGGLVSLLMDEAMAWACAVAARSFCTTGELRIKLRDSVPPDRELILAAFVIRVWGKLLRAQAELCLPEGRCLAVATASFAALPPDESQALYRKLCVPPGSYNPLSSSADPLGKRLAKKLGP